MSAGGRGPTQPPSRQAGLHAAVVHAAVVHAVVPARLPTVTDTVFSPPLWAWVATVVAILVLVAVDIRHARSPHEVTFREATQWSVAYVGAAVLFGVVLLVSAGGSIGAQYFAGWLIEKSLSVDNLFVFAVILSSFAVPPRHQQKVLLFGVLGALVLRVIFIAVGAAVIERFAVTFVVFGAFLIYTAIQLVRSHDSEPDVQHNRGLKLLRRVVPVTDSYDEEGHFFTRLNGRRAATPVLAVTVVILSVDIVFALDSIPAIFGVTSSPYLVITANAFALLGLRALYFMLVGLLDRLVYLSYGLAIILAFIGVKLVLHYLHTDVSGSVPEISTALSLVVVVAILAVTTVLSLRRSAADPERSAAGDRPRR